MSDPKPKPVKPATPAVATNPDGTNPNPTGTSNPPPNPPPTPPPTAGTPPSPPPTGDPGKPASVLIHLDRSNEVDSLQAELAEAKKTAEDATKKLEALGLEKTEIEARLQEIEVKRTKDEIEALVKRVPETVQEEVRKNLYEGGPDQIAKTKILIDSLAGSSALIPLQKAVQVPGGQTPLNPSDSSKRYPKTEAGIQRMVMEAPDDKVAIFWQKYLEALMAKTKRKGVTVNVSELLKEKRRIDAP